MKKIITVLGLIGLLVMGVVYLPNYISDSLVKPYTPPASETSVVNLKELLPYKTSKFEISWNESAGHAEAVIYKPHPDSANALLNWLADNNANNLPKNTVKIIRK